jgi:hypothetical protein
MENGARVSHMTRRWAQRVVLGVAVVGVVAALMGCAALPGDTLDPLSPILGLSRREGTPAQAPAQRPAASGVPDTP